MSLGGKRGAKRPCTACSTGPVCRCQQGQRGRRDLCDYISRDDDDTTCKPTFDQRPLYDAAADLDNVSIEVTTGEGDTLKIELPPTEKVLRVKEEVERELGIATSDACMFCANEAFEKELEEETVGMLREGKGKKVLLSLLVSKADAQQVVPELVAEAQMVLGDGTAGSDDGQLNNPYAVAFVLGRPEWIVTTEFTGHRVKISNILTGALVCKLGELGNGEGQFKHPWGVAVTADSSFVLVVDSDNHRVQVLRLVVNADGSSAELEFDHFIGHGYGGHNSIEDCDVPGAEGQLSDPNGIALLPGNGSQEMVLVVEEGSHRVSQFALDGTFIRIFAGSGNGGSADGELDSPVAIAVLGSSGEVAIADASDDRSVQIFDSAGNFKRQFGSFGSFGVETDGQFQCVTAVVSDDHGNLLILDYTNRLQVFSPTGKHLCTRNDLGLSNGGAQGIAWSAAGGLAVANGSNHQCLFWG